MKKSVFVTTSLCAVLCTALFSQGSAGFAMAQNEGSDSYPSNFTKRVQFENLQDYAIGEDKSYFLDDDTVYVYGNDDYKPTEETVDFTAKEAGEFLVNGYTYSLLDSDELLIWNRDMEAPQKLGGFSNLKRYGDYAYAVKENVLYCFNGAEPVEYSSELKYYDYSAVNYINIGNTADKLKNADGNAPTFVKLNQGAFMTKIKDISDLSGDYFETDGTIKTDVATVLLLCKIGENDGISIVMVKEEQNGKEVGACYMLRTEDAKEVTRGSLESRQDSATVTIAEGYIYSSPFVCSATKVEKITSGNKVEIQGVIRQEQNGEIFRDFYLVQLENGTKGYVPQEYISLFSYVEKEPEATIDPEYSEDDLIKPVVLILIVIALVFIAIGYVVFVGTSGKKKKKDGKDNKKK